MVETEPELTTYTVAAFTEPSTPSLRMARDRVAWASKRLTELARLNADLGRANDEDSLILTIAKAAVDRATWERGGRPDVHLDWSRANRDAFQVDVHLLGSEVLNHSRTALDYVAFSLAWLDAGRQFAHTKFPFVKDAAAWRKESKSALRGVSPSHVLRLEAYQPFAGCAWSGKLRDLNNRDKHQFAVAVSADQTVWLPRDFSAITLDEIPGQPDGLRVRTSGQLAEIVLPDRAAAIPALREIVQGVAGVIVDLQGDFGESVGLVETHVPV